MHNFSALAELTISTHTGMVFKGLTLIVNYLCVVVRSNGR